MGKICVIGGANIDICGASLQPLRNFDSNPGTIEIRFGGVGRNIAQIISLLGEHPMLVTCFSNDAYGKQMKKDCEELGMDTTCSVVTEDLPSSIYIAILDDNRDMKIGMSDMRILRRLTNEDIDHAYRSLTKDDLVILDANLSMETIEYAVQNAPCLTAADPVSANKAARMKPVLKHMTIFKPNQYEAAEITGIPIRDEKSASESLQWFLDAGVQEIIISMADRGILIGTRKNKIWMTHRTILLDNATGGGDTFMGAYCVERCKGIAPLEAARYAATAAVTAIESNAAARRKFSDEMVRSQIGAMNIKEKVL